MSVEKIGLGLAALGRPGYINLGHHEDLPQAKEVDHMKKHSRIILDAAWDAGIRYYDAARSYGKAEAFLASWLKSRNIPSQDIRVGSKWGYEYTAQWQVHAEKHEVKDHSLHLLEKQWPESKSLLGDYLDLYQIHSATLESGVLENQEVLAFLGARKTQGLEIGLSLSGPHQGQTLDKAQQITFQGNLLFDWVQATWNLLESSVETSLREAQKKGMKVILKETLANGRLSPRGQDHLSKQQHAILQSLSQKYQTSVDALSLAAALANPFANIVLLGVASLEHLESNLKSLALEIRAEDRTLLRDMVEPPREYWQTRKNLGWN